VIAEEGTENGIENVVHDVTEGVMMTDHPEGIATCSTIGEDKADEAETEEIGMEDSEARRHESDKRAQPLLLRRRNPRQI
jgi:hypothetical protein